MEQKTTRKPKGSPPVYSAEEIDSLIEEATVDAYGFEEQLGSWVVYLGDELTFPFPVKVIGKTVQAIGIEERDELVKLKIKSTSKVHWINIHDVQIVMNGNEKNRNDVLIHAYLKWYSPDGARFNNNMNE